MAVFITPVADEPARPFRPDADRVHPPVTARGVGRSWTGRPRQEWHETTRAGEIPGPLAFPWCLLPDLCARKARGTATWIQYLVEVGPRPARLIQSTSTRYWIQVKAVLEQPSPRGCG